MHTRLGPALLFALSIAACGGKATPTPAAPDVGLQPAPTPSTPDAAAPTPTAPDVVAPPTPTPAQPDATPPKPDTVAAAAPAATGLGGLGLTDADIAGYKTALNAGRKAVKEKRYADGLVHFEAALKHLPGDARVLGEIGWAAYLAGEFKKAERFTKAALEGARTPQTQGAVLYNLGRIYEDTKQLSSAVGYYKRSLKVRPNATVKARLDVLTGGTDAKYAVMRIGDLDTRRGPPPADVCEAFLAQTEDDSWGYDRTCVATPFDEQITKHSRALVFTHDYEGDYPRWQEGTSYELAIIDGGRWYTTVLGGTNTSGASKEVFSLDALRVVDVVPGGPPEVIVEITAHGLTLYDDMTWVEESDSSTFIFALGDTPTSIGHVRTAWSHQGGTYDYSELPDSDDMVRTSTQPAKTGQATLSFDPTAGTLTIADQRGDIGSKTQKAGTWKVADYPIQTSLDL